MYGHIERFYVARDRETNASRGFAYLTFSMHREAEAAKVRGGGGGGGAGWRRRRGRTAALRQSSHLTRTRTQRTIPPPTHTHSPQAAMNNYPYLHLILKVEWAKPSVKPDGSGSGGPGGGSMNFVSGYGKALPQVRVGRGRGVRAHCRESV